MSLSELCFHLGTLVGQNTLHCKADGEWTTPVYECSDKELAMVNTTNRPPTTIIMTPRSIRENTESDLAICWLRSIDPDKHHRHTYTLNNNNHMFSINGSEVYLKGAYYLLLLAESCVFVKFMFVQHCLSLEGDSGIRFTQYQ